MTKSIIVARSTNYVIGNNNGLPWKMSGDLQHFKRTTIGHHLLMGRKTFESIGKPLPHRTTIILTHEKNYKVPNCLIANTLQEAFYMARQGGETELFIAGGSQIYHQALDFVNKIYLTKIHTTITGDTFFPSLGKHWIETRRTNYYADAKNRYDYSFIELTRKYIQ